MLLANLCELSTHVGDYAQGEAYIDEARPQARQLGYPWLTCTILLHEGELRLAQKLIEQAATVFAEALAGIPKENQELFASAGYGLARVALAQHRFEEARNVGEKSLAAFQAIAHAKAKEVRLFLDTLPAE